MATVMATVMDTVMDTALMEPEVWALKQHNRAGQFLVNTVKKMFTDLWIIEHTTDSSKSTMEEQWLPITGFIF